MSYKSIEVTGKTEDEAIEKALRQLGLDRDEVSVELLERAKSGFLGLKTTPAKIKVTYEVEDEVPVVERMRTRQETSEVPVSPVSSASADASRQALDDRAKKAKDFLIGLFAKMNVNAIPDVTETEHGISVKLRGEKLGAIIGRRGETLDAIQHLTNYTVNKGMESRVRISIDAENYREKREDSLKSLAERMAGKAIKYKRNYKLEPMNSYERHVIHSELQTTDMVTTYSTGTEPNRRVVIAYDRNKSSESHSQSNSVSAWK